MPTSLSGAIAFVVYSLALALVSVSGYEPGVTAVIVAVGALVTLLAANYRSLGNLLIFMSIVLVLLPGLFVSYILVLRSWGIPAFIIDVSKFAQVQSVMVKAVFATLLFASSLFAGWLIAAGRETGNQGESRLPLIRHSPLTIGAIGMVFATSVLSFHLQAGGSIFAANYGSSVGSAPIISGMWGLLAVFCLMLIETSEPGRGKGARRFLNLLWAGLFGLFFFHGVRVEALAGAMTLLCCRVAAFRRQLATIAVSAAIVVPFFLFLGTYRNLASRTGGSWQEAAQLSAGSLSSAENEGTIGGIGAVALTSVAGVYLVDSGRFPPAWGRLYASYIPRFLPTFLNPDPLHVGGAWIFLEYGVPTVGGITPVSESYLSFGAFGPLLVGSLFGFALGRLRSLSVRNDSHFFTCALIVAISICFRIFFYELFTFFKAELVFCIFYGAVVLLNRATLVTEPGSALSRA